MVEGERTILMAKSFHCKDEQPRANTLYVKNPSFLHKASPKWVKILSKKSRIYIQMTYYTINNSK